MKLLNGGICAFFLAFATLRAARVPLTYDEAASYIRYIDANAQSVFDPTVFSIFDFEVATNHFLNTLLTKGSTIVAGGSEFALRLPNLIADVMFIVYSLRILQRYARPWIATTGMLLLNLNPYVLDFFSLSRGYGLSLGFLMGAVFYLLRLLDELSARPGPLRDASRVLAFALAAVLSNFALLNVWLSIFLMTQSGDVVAKRQIVAAPQSDFDVSEIRLNGIAISEDAKTIWMTATGANRQGFVLRIPAFGGGTVTTDLLNQARGNLPTDQGTDIFSHDMTTSQALGPLFNERSCAGCHNTPNPGGMPMALVGWVAGCTSIWSALFAEGNFLYGRYPQALLLTAMFVVSGVILARIVSRTWASSERQT